ncbi:MAG TPA: SDR family oxidoreductase [Bacteroidetes bacterium]|nr:SDR family oxidoreductase [Bacteroidota bacterium]
MEFTGKNILITGGSRGIGKATAQLFAEKGGRVCINFLQNTTAATAVIEGLAGDGHFAVRADLSDPTAVEQMMETFLEECETLDVVVNNAGVFISHPIADTTYEEWQKAWQTTLGLNLLGAANVCWFAGRQMMKQGGGHIINVSSRGAFRGEPEHTAYGAGKAGLNSLTQSLAVELGPHGVIATAVAPGYVETDMVKELLEGKKGKAIKSQSPLRRVATPMEVAHVIVFLASKEAAYMTGAIVDINGASYLRS